MFLPTNVLNSALHVQPLISESTVLHPTLYPNLNNLAIVQLDFLRL